jgi:hypothetical protein
LIPTNGALSFFIEGVTESSQPQSITTTLIYDGVEAVQDVVKYESKGPIAGMEVGSQLRHMLRIVDNVINELTLDEIILIHDSMRLIPWNLGAWDITEMFEAGGGGEDKSVFSEYNDRIYNSNGSLMVDGKPFWAAEVNYVLFGFVRRAIHEHFLENYGTTALGTFYNIPDHAIPVVTLTGSKALVTVYRNIFFATRNYEPLDSLPDQRSRGPGVAGRNAWTEIGWNYYDTLGDSFSDPPDHITDRYITPNEKIYFGSYEIFLGLTPIPISDPASPTGLIYPHLLGVEFDAKEDGTVEATKVTWEMASTAISLTRINDVD